MTTEPRSTITSPFDLPADAQASDEIAPAQQEPVTQVQKEKEELGTIGGPDNAVDIDNEGDDVDPKSHVDYRAPDADEAFDDRDSIDLTDGDEPHGNSESKVAPHDVTEGQPISEQGPDAELHPEPQTTSEAKNAVSESKSAFDAALQEANSATDEAQHQNFSEFKVGGSVSEMDEEPEDPGLLEENQEQGSGHGVGGVTMSDVEERELPMAMDAEKIAQFNSQDDEDDEAIQADPRELEHLLSAYMTRTETLSHKNVALEARNSFYTDVIIELQGKLGVPPGVPKADYAVMEHLTAVEMSKRIDVLTQRNLVQKARVKFFEQYIGAQSRIIEEMSAKIRELGSDPQPILNAYFAPQHDGRADSDDPSTSTE